MSDAKHTPGPWEASYGTDGYYQLTHDDGLELKKNVEANCRVLGAAPDLLEALKLAKRLFDEALPKFDWGKSALDANAIRLLNEAPLAVAAAIAKATS